MVNTDKTHGQITENLHGHSLQTVAVNTRNSQKVYIFTAEC